MLLRNIIADFLDKLPNERALDLPFLSLLADMGFRDVHFTHGPAEFGKDFIAKRTEEGCSVQYGFQSKVGDISQGAWRSEVMPQMLEALESGLSHPSFDPSQVRAVVLTASGRLTGNAPIAFQDFKTRHEGPLRRIDCWDRERLIEYFIDNGPDSFYRGDAKGSFAYGSFFVAYGDALRGALEASTIELHSRAWASTRRQDGIAGFTGALEAELLAAACRNCDRDYESIVCILGYMRALMATLWDCSKISMDASTLFDATLSRAAGIAWKYIQAIQVACEEQEGDFARAVGGATIVAYPVECSRAMEVAALLYFIGNTSQKALASSFLTSFVDEPGCMHPVSDRWAVSVVVAALALVFSGHEAKARKLVLDVAKWVSKRYEEGFGLAEFDASPQRETDLLFGFPFDSVNVTHRRSSFLATALCDLAAFIGDESLFLDIVGEFEAVKVAFQYWQPLDTQGQFRIDGIDVIQYPNVEYQSQLTPFQLAQFGSHVANEDCFFRLASNLGARGYIGIILLLRDRYFPMLWAQLRP